MKELSEMVNKIRSFSSIEECDEMAAHNKKTGELAEIMLRENFDDGYEPKMIVPTRSGGVVLDYRIGGVEIYYRFEGDGVSHVSKRVDGKSINHWDNPQKITNYLN